MATFPLMKCQYGDDDEVDVAVKSKHVISTPPQNLGKRPCLSTGTHVVLAEDPVQSWYIS